MSEKVRWKRLAANLLLLTVTMIVTLAALEVFFRFYIGGQTHTVGGPAFRINDKEMNEYYLRDTALPNTGAGNGSGGTLTILALGDSFTYGHGIKDPANAWPNRLQQLINNYTGGNTVVVNAGLPGMGTVDELLLFETVGKEYKPGIVFLGYSVNDAVNDQNYASSQIVYNVHVRKIKPPQQQEALKRYREAKAEYARDMKEYEVSGLYGKAANFLFTKSYLWFFIVTRYDTIFRKVTFAERYQDELAQDFSTGNHSKHLGDLRTLADEVKSANATLIILMIPYPVGLSSESSYPFNSAHDMIKRFGKENNITVMDPLPDFLGKDAKQLQVNKYDLHLNEEGHRLLAYYAYKHVGAWELQKAG